MNKKQPDTKRLAVSPMTAVLLSDIKYLKGGKFKKVRKGTSFVVDVSHNIGFFANDLVDVSQANYKRVFLN